MKTKYLSGLLLLVVACSGGQTTGGDGTGNATKAQLKQAAAQAHGENESSGSGDVCANEGWYGDGECDTFCQDADAKDCTPNSDGVVCAAFLEEENGFCSRKPGDPCIGQDPDCGSDGPICTAIAREPDGVCKEDPSDPCGVFQDPDCNSGGGGTPTDPADPIVCTDISQLPDGVCTDDPKDPCDVYQDPDCQGGSEPSYPGTPACKVAPEPSDGVCSRKPSDPCVTADPDCTEPVACAEYIELSDGVCGREPNDPCIFQDPDCHVK
jgi:hypothetical protein